MSDCNKDCNNCQCKSQVLSLDPKTLYSPLASDTAIDYLCSSAVDKPLFTPYVNQKTSKDDKGRSIPSYGLSSAGYDMRCDGNVLVFKGKQEDIVDPRNVDKDLFEKLPVLEDDTGRYVLIPPKAFILSASLEWVNIPRTHLAIVNTKSTYARAGLQTLTTPLENFWSGVVTLEFVNNTTSQIKLYIDGGVVQVNLFYSHGVTKDYIQAGGKYQNQIGITHAKC